eukprot:SAG31_NODE_540_length_14288_cov_51.958066_9_plen_165_part_00
MAGPHHARPPGGYPDTISTRPAPAHVRHAEAGAVPPCRLKRPFRLVRGERHQEGVRRARGLITGCGAVAAPSLGSHSPLAARFAAALEQAVSGGRATAGRATANATAAGSLGRSSWAVGLGAHSPHATASVPGSIVLNYRSARRWGERASRVHPSVLVRVRSPS